MTLLMSSCYLDETVYFKRTLRWLEYHLKLRREGRLEFTDVFLIDNASHPTHIHTLQQLYPNISIISRLEHYRREAWIDYKYIWVPIAKYADLLKTFDRIIYMENDVFLLSNYACKTVETCTGWSTPFCNKWGFPETALQVITREAEGYNRFLAEGDPYRFNGITGMEDALKPYLNILDLKGDRYSEYPMLIPTDADYAAQVGLEHAVSFED